MRLDSEINADGTGKYALIKLREAPFTKSVEIGSRLYSIVPNAAIDFGKEDEFFVIRLKDIGAVSALMAYAKVYSTIDPEWTQSIYAMIQRAKKLERKVAD